MTSINETANYVTLERQQHGKNSDSSKRVTYDQPDIMDENCCLLSSNCRKQELVVARGAVDANDDANNTAVQNRYNNDISISDAGSHPLSAGYATTSIYVSSASSREGEFVNECATENDDNIQRLRQASRVIINVSGIRHEVAWKILATKPFSRLGRMHNSSSSKELLTLCDDFTISTSTGLPEFYFDRPSYPFKAVLQYYQTGKLHALDDMCVLALGDELAYWGIEESVMEHCCLANYLQKKEKVQEELRKEAELFKPQDEEEDFGQGRFASYRKWLWDLMEKPHTSTAAKVIAIISVSFVLVSTTALMLNSMEAFREEEPKQSPATVVYTMTTSSDYVLSEEQNVTQLKTAAEKTGENRILTYVDYVCIAWFTGEYIIRLWSAPGRWQFVKSPMNIIDVLAFLPFYVSFMLSLFSLDAERFDGLRRVVQTFRVMRVLRVLKLARHSAGLQAFGYTMQNSYKELGMLLLFLFISILMFSSLEYYAEKDDGNPLYTSIPATFWWAAVSMTTVGYGDMYPFTAFGKIVAAMCCICGVIVIALPIPIIVNNFTDFYSEQKKKEKMLQSISNKKPATNQASTAHIDNVNIVLCKFLEDKK